MNAKISVFVFFFKHLLLYNLHNCTFKMLFFFLRFLVFYRCTFYESLLHEYSIYRVVQCHPLEPKYFEAYVISLLRWLTVYTIPSLSSNKLKGSGTCPTSCSFVTLRSFFFFFSSLNRNLIELMLCLLASSLVHLNSSLTIRNSFSLLFLLTRR